MKLSVIIVNYNVRYFLEQALLSVRKAASGIDHEVWVVDNNSVDGSVEMLESKFPEVKIIINTTNTGFSRANNQAILQSKGEYVLLLNPDTVVGEDTFLKCIQKMDEDQEIGAIGVRMIDGGGNYLPESKRGFPSPMTAFFKTTGLYRLFPKSGYFNKYYHGDLNPGDNHYIEILSGAFMFIRRDALDKAGLLDEDFFMYGEDIDLSYRILKAGYKNYYLADTTIIHYKGESTKKGTLNYIKTFYQAMIIFANKHFKGSSASVYIAFIRMAVFLRGFLALLSGFVSKYRYLIMDSFLLFVSLMVCKEFWSVYRYDNPDYFPHHFTYINVPIYVSIWVIAIYFNKGYERPDGYFRLFRGLALGTVVIAAIYGFLDLEYRNSRAVIILALLVGVALLSIYRVLAVSLRLKRFAVHFPVHASILVVGNQEESNRLKKLMSNGLQQKSFVGYVAPVKTIDDNDCLGEITNLPLIATMYRINEIIFCAKDIHTTDMMNWMSAIGPSVTYKILPTEGSFVIGSHSKESLGELYTFEISLKINQKPFQVQKRILDFVLSAILLLLSPVLLMFYKDSGKLRSNLLKVLTGKLSFVGYANPEDATDLPNQKNGILTPLDELNASADDKKLIQSLNFMYAKDIDIFRYLQIIFKGFNKLNRQTN
ncbi:MAG TPA: glycosyltransferase [Saprospiraceae bacterium]|nr:glycosyltransferase [Saprospiraceae bacterium]HMX82066.1 glycosyltransferase [Saprospiraceae bacterium]HMX85047.1 glycosyltransferase [Saprospiraceae bacterium]HMZ72141.1 glycosyltransferase [Saprospiraceae bacterium]HNA94108.1 glycosyltransferase [Saprospiraceae bacterium]